MGQIGPTQSVCLGAKCLDNDKVLNALLRCKLSDVRHGGLQMELRGYFTASFAFSSCRIACTSARLSDIALEPDITRVASWRNRASN